jgi:hypothetical protein
MSILREKEKTDTGDTFLFDISNFDSSNSSFVIKRKV